MLAHTMRSAIVGTQLKWLLWIDSDIIILKGHGHPKSNWIIDVIEFATLGSPYIEQTTRESVDSIDIIVADQRNSQFGDINAGTIIFRVSDWNIAFLEAWWGHPHAIKVHLNPLSSLFCGNDQLHSGRV